jgi:adenylate cyclase
MAKEIERKFLVKDTIFKAMAVKSMHIRQAYLSRNPGATVRVRLRDDEAYLTIKGRTIGATRDEWEYAIPVDDAQSMIDRLADGTVIDKTRYIVPFGGMMWEVDEFHGAHSGLVVAEIELTSENQAIDLPPFIEREVTGDSRYYNSNLAK